MVRTHNATKRQKVAESALFTPDVVFLVGSLLDARDLCRVSRMCKTLGAKRASAFDGLSMVEEAARRLFECASDCERSCLPKYHDEGWIELYHHLLMLRSKLTFDQLVGFNIQYGDDQSIVETPAFGSISPSSALCSNHVMRSGRHFVFVMRHWGILYRIVVRPVQINRSDFDVGELRSFYPGAPSFREYLIGQRTNRWSDSNVHCCNVSLFTGKSYWYDWASPQPEVRVVGGFQSNTPFGLLLDLDEGTLSAYQNGQRLATLKDGLSGEYCWYASLIDNVIISIERGLASEG